ncbi:MAG: 5'/3'-nucleotidase SurE [Candidatus Neomarinimicrobiota bacterium]
MTVPLKILLSNDDGIYSDGIYALWQAMSEIGEVTVVAPVTEKSAAGHSITIADPIRIEEITRAGGFKGFAVGGTPADCVKIAVGALLNEPPDIIVSGINAGANVGGNILYSGTISAATEGTIRNIPSLAISLDSITGGDLSGAKEIAKTVVRSILKNGLPQGTLLNVNIPNLPASEIRGYKITHQGKLYFKDSFDKREDPRGRTYYWMTGKIVNNDTDIESDGNVLADGYVSITPINFQITDKSFIGNLKSWTFD